ncbi:MAG TPA: 2-C-methyl-D-erythritol 4-phosphate cytidylyltransferase [Vicinamibacterales bacterium]|jgi:2-C-methyl-D-erythritol 4-phosphate cytidylyltransferase/2-C-methyl-D-erythritol 2,4-cyclodiphosphate synthase
MSVSAIIAAGGRGRRLGADVPKQLLSIGGRPMLEWSVRAFLGCGCVDEVVVVVPPDVAEDPPSYLRGVGVKVVAGGLRRQDSVANGFEATSPASDVVVIHDAARPFVDARMIARSIDAARESGAAIAAVAARDTVKWSPAGTGDDRRVIERTLPRESVFLAQTPQAFRREVLRDAVALGRQVDATDEAALAERAGHPVRLIEGSPRNIKVTTREDLAIAEALLDKPGSSRSGLRIGSGYDLHRLVEGRPLILGGVTIPSDRGLAGHSDADALCHAITDAVLGAAAAGDIGQHFPDADERWRGASSTELLRQVVALVAGRGYRVVNVDATLVVERPMLGPYRAAMVARLAEVLGLAPDAVSVKAKTNEGVDAAGRGEAIAVHAVALLERVP